MKRILRYIILLLSLISLGFSREDNVKSIPADSVGKLQASERNQPIQEPAKRYGVVPFNDTLFYISNRMGSHSAMERAQSISKRIRSLYHAPFFYPDSLVLVQNDLSMEIHYLPDMILMSVTGMDASSANKSMEELAKEDLILIKNAIEKERELFSFSNVIKRLVWIAVILVILGLIIYLINYLFRILNAFLKRNTQYFQNRIRLFNSQLIDSDLLEEIIFKISGFLKLFLIILVVLIT
ncbi:MAG TPA: hypothetical protein VN249_09215, partial [Prolixibacteraceae bacterium]|nr:hypothetical protein [Prolixibacteraceae bacterium]